MEDKKDLNEIANYISQKFLYSPFDAALTAYTIADFSELTWKAFLTFRKKGILPSWSVEGLTCSIFLKNGCNPITALIHLDWLIKTPEMASRCLAEMKNPRSPIYHQTLF